MIATIDDKIYSLLHRARSKEAEALKDNNAVVYHNNGYLETTDDYMLLRIKADYDKSLEEVGLKRDGTTCFIPKENYYPFDFLISLVKNKATDKLDYNAFTEAVKPSLKIDKEQYFKLKNRYIRTSRAKSAIAVFKHLKETPAVILADTHQFLLESENITFGCVVETREAVVAELDAATNSAPVIEEPAEKAIEIKTKRTLAIDIETFSSYDLTTAGVYKYVESPDFDILLFAYAYDNEPVRVIDLAQGELLSDELLRDLYSPDVIKTAYNANFEITCLNVMYKPLDPTQWECTMVRAAMAGLPLSLEMTAKTLKLEEQKMALGKTLLRYFSMPVNPTRANGMRTRNHPHHDPDKWQLFKQYCAQDVNTERAVRDRLSFLKITNTEREMWLLDQDINARGVLIDNVLVNNAIFIDENTQAEYLDRAKKLTGLANPASPAQLKSWLTEQGCETDSLTKANVNTLLEGSKCEVVSEVLELRQKMSKTSVKKYEAMQSAVCEDGRVRGLLQYYGANRTGRWAGRLVQVQNLPQNHLSDLDTARGILTLKNPVEAQAYLSMCYDNPPDVLSQLVRTAFVPKKGCKFIIADYSAIEARVIAWLAGETWRTDVFNTHGKIYEASASQMFKVPIDEITKGSELRQKGKIAELACGYQGGVGALKAMGAVDMGIPEKELQGIIDRWRASNPNIVRLWDDVNDAALTAIENSTCVGLPHDLVFSYEKGMLIIRLPSDRKLHYLRAKIDKNSFGYRTITYEEANQNTKKWERTDTYGGKLVENIVQAIARDCLAENLLRLDFAGYSAVMHVHDEVVLEVPAAAEEDLQDVLRIMSVPLQWAEGLNLTVDGFISDYYKKD